MTVSKLTRRRFMFLTGVSGTALAVGYFVACNTQRGEKQDLFSFTNDPPVGTDLRNFIIIGADDSITLINHKPEIGQGSFQAMPALIAEELEVDPDKVQLKQAMGNPVRYGSQGVGGSYSVRGNWTRLRKVGASAKYLMIAAAATAWGVDPENCYAEDGKIKVRDSSEVISYGKLIGKAAALEDRGLAAHEALIKAAARRWGLTGDGDLQTGEGKVRNRKNLEELTYEELKADLDPAEEGLTADELVEALILLELLEDPPLKDPKDFKILGKPMPRKDIELKVEGSAIFGIDESFPGMLYASVARCPTFHGKVKQYDEAAAMSVPGVKKVFKVSRNVFHWKMEGVAVVADSYWAAYQGRQKLNVEWDHGDMRQWSQSKIENLLRRNLDLKGVTHREAGDFAGAYANAPKQVEAQYETPYLAHLAMEPLNAVVHVAGDRCVIRSSTQDPGWLMGDVARMLDIPLENVEFYVPFAGGGFGRRGFNDYIPEAALISREVEAPVKVVWTREDDTTQGPFRPPTFHKVQGALDNDGNLVAYKHVMTGQHTRVQDQQPNGSDAPTWIMEGINGQYVVPNNLSSYVLASIPIPVIWWRSVYFSTNPFAEESFIDEMAHAADRDPVEFRLALLKDKPRHTAVLKEVASKAGWDKPLPEGRGRGVALVESFGSICAEVVEVSNAGGQLKVEKVIAAIDCGMYVNPDNVRAQVEGAIIMALGAALKPPITFSEGAAREDNFHRHQILRIHEAPPVEVYIMENQEDPGGVGEPGVPPLAPALANALFNLSGERVRKLPLV